MARATGGGGKGEGDGGTGRRGSRSGAGKASPTSDKPWRREHPGAYVSADGRFRLEQEGAGRWFVVDQEQLDELGLARTTGPFGTLEGARQEADRLRSMPATVSPLLPRIAAQRERQSRGAAIGRATAAAAKTAPAARTANDAKGTKGAKSPTPAAPQSSAPVPDAAPDAPPAPVHRPEPARPEPAPPPPTWLERLPPDEATRARRLIAALGRLRIADAERTVRVDVEGGRPAVARSIIARRLREAALESWTRRDAFDRADDAVRDALRHAASIGLGDDEVAAVVEFVARRTLAATLEQVSGLERDPDAPASLPGWRLVEHDPARPDRGRRIDVTGDDVARLRLDPGPDSGK